MAEFLGRTHEINFYGWDARLFCVRGLLGEFMGLLFCGAVPVIGGGSIGLYDATEDCTCSRL